MCTGTTGHGRRSRASCGMPVQSQCLVTSDSVSLTGSICQPYTCPSGGRSALPTVHSIRRSGTNCVTVLRTLYLTRPGMSFNGVRSMSMSKVSPTSVSGLASGAASSIPEPSIWTCPAGLDTIWKSVLAGAAMRRVAAMRSGDTDISCRRGTHRHAIRRVARTDRRTVAALTPYALRCAFAAALNAGIARRPRGAGPCSGLLNGIENEHRDLPGRRGYLVFREIRPFPLLPLPDLLPLARARDARLDRDGLRAHLDGRVRVRHQVVIPVWVGRGAPLRGKNSEAIADRLVDKRAYPLRAAFRPRVVQEQHGGARERAAHLARVRAELFDDLRVEIASGFCHASDSRVFRSGRMRACSPCPACRYWADAGAAAELRMLRPGSRPGVAGRAHLHLRVHLVPRLRGEGPARRLPELRRRARPAPGPPGSYARRPPALDPAGGPARMRLTHGGLARCAVTTGKRPEFPQLLLR